MGNKGSTQSQRCSYCGYTFGRNSDIREKCNRCAGLCGPVERVALKTLHCGVIVDSVDEKCGLELEEERLLDSLKKYFMQHKAQVRRGIIFQTQDNHRFKILHCHPPAGVLKESTKLIITGSSGSVIRLNTSRIISKLDLKPIRASLPPSQRKSVKDSISLLPEIRKYFTELSTSSRPNHLSTGELFTTSSGIEFRAMKVESAGDEPGEDGIVDLNQTVIYCSGSPINDIKKITLLPIYETLPNREKNYSAQAILETYIKPHTFGLSVYVQKLQELPLNGVDFAITACEPDSGILTCDTTITNTQANIRAGDWRSKKMEEDEALARRLQDENRTLFFGAARSPLNLSIVNREPSNSGPPGPGPPIGYPGPPPPLGANNRLQVLQHLLNIIHNPDQDMGRGINPQLSQLLGSRLVGMAPRPTAAHLSGRLPTWKYKKIKRSSPPVSEVKIMDGSISESKEGMDEDNAASPKCRICLEYYEDGEDVKTLPCFHIFHAECIDKWFQLSDECCICKNSLTASFRQVLE